MDEAALLSRVPELASIMETAYWLSYRGWSEGHAGNISLRMAAGPGVIDMPATGEPVGFSGTFKELAGCVLAVSVAGRRMRDAMRRLEGNVMLVRVLPDGSAYEPLWGAGRPTSELPAHLRIHRTLVQHHPERRAILHTHPPCLIAITHLPPSVRKGVVENVLFRLHPETVVFMPEGAELIPFRVPGTEELGYATAHAFIKKRMALWEKHGVVAVAQDLPQALDCVEVLEKAAEIYWKAGGKPEGLKKEDVDATRARWVEKG